MASLVDKFGDKMHSMGETIDEAMDNRPQTFSGQAVDVYRTASTGHAHALVDLVIHGADISLEFLDAQERTPLLAACTNGHLACAQILLERGANAAAIDLDGNTALHVACMHGRVEIVSMLLMSSSHVMSPYILNKKGQNALRLSRMIVQAKADGWPQVVQCITALEERVKVFEGWIYHRSQSMFAWQSWEARYALVLRTGSTLCLEMHLFHVHNGLRTPIPTLVFDIDVDKPVMLYRDGDGLNRKPLAIGLESQVLAAFNEPGFEAWGTFFTSHMSAAVFEGSRPPASAVAATTSSHQRSPPPSTKDLSVPLDQLHPLPRSSSPSSSPRHTEASAPAWDDILRIELPTREMELARSSSTSPRTQASTAYTLAKGLDDNDFARLSSIDGGRAPTFERDEHADGRLLDGRGRTSDEECAVCMARSKQTVCVPCGHVAACLQCALEIQRTSRTCPLCRTPVKELVKLWLTQ